MALGDNHAKTRRAFGADRRRSGGSEKSA